MVLLRSTLVTLFLLPATAFSAEGKGDTTTGVEKLTPPVGAGDVLQVFIALIFVLLLIGLTAWLLRRFSVNGFSRPGALRMLASISVGQRERIVLVQAGETQLLLGVAQGSVRTLHVFDKPVMLDNGGAQGGERFAERLAAALHRRGGEEK